MKTTTEKTAAGPVEREAKEMGFTPEAASLLGQFAGEKPAPITQAPWHVNAILGNRIVGDVSAPKFDKLQICNSNATVATVYRRADARLIAAAPELLAALQKIDANAAESYQWIRRVAREAIEKATGGAL